jgi:hypothetical protein
VSEGITTRWVDGPTCSDTEWTEAIYKIESIMSTRGWMSLNRYTSRIRVAEDEEGNLKGFFVFQFLPSCGPMWVAPSERGSGLADELADDMQSFLEESKARGWIIICDNPVAAKMCQAREMKKVESPVYVRS